MESTVPGRGGAHRLPFLPISADFFCESVSLLTHEQLGLHLRLAWLAWTNGSVPADLPSIARLLATPMPTIRRLWPALEPLWPTYNGSGRRLNAHVEERRARAQESSQQRTESGRRGAQMRWHGYSDAIGNPNGSPDGDAIGREVQEKGREVQEKPTEEVRTARSARSSVAVARPPDVPEQVWSDWTAHRQKIKATITPTVIAGFRREAEKAGIPLAEALSVSATQGWRGFRAEFIRDRRNGTNGRNGHDPLLRGYKQEDYSGPTIQDL